VIRIILGRIIVVGPRLARIVVRVGRRGGIRGLVNRPYEKKRLHYNLLEQVLLALTASL
jgi:hypothetical protein